MLPHRLFTGFHCVLEEPRNYSRLLTNILTNYFKHIVNYWRFPIIGHQLTGSIWDNNIS
jgi:hypothetical protein